MRTFLTGLAATLLPATAALAADDVTLQLKWVTQAQFAGYYVALDKGFYEAEGLNVTIKPGGPDIAPPSAALPDEPPAEESFETTPAFAWLSQHAARHGFSLSYPRGNPHGIVYEPWHWRFRSRARPAT